MRQAFPCKLPETFQDSFKLLDSIQTSVEGFDRLSCPRMADTAFIHFS